MSQTKRKSVYEHNNRYYKESGDCDYLKELNGRDKKSRRKPPGWWKRIRRKIRRAKQKNALRNNKMQPVEKHNDVWEWN